MGGSCSTVSFEPCMANQPRETKGNPSREASPRPPHAGNENPNVAVTSLGDSKRAERDRRRVWKANLLRGGDGPCGYNEALSEMELNGGCSSSSAPEWSLPTRSSAPTICSKSQEERAPGERAGYRQRTPQQSGADANYEAGLSVPKQRRASIHGAPHQQEARSRHAADQKAPHHWGRLVSDPPQRKDGGGPGRRSSVVW